MTKDVLITISGMQFDIEEEPVELVTVGTYYLKNGKHYVLYEEQTEGNGQVTKNIVKFYEGHFEMTKRVKAILSCYLKEKKRPQPCTRLLWVQYRLMQ